MPHHFTQRLSGISFPQMISFATQIKRTNLYRADTPLKEKLMTDIPRTMNANVLMRHRDMDALEFKTDWPTPTPTRPEVLIKVAACGLNNTDTNTRSGWYSKNVEDATTGGAYTKISDTDPSWGGAPLAFPRIQEVDVCGHVAAVDPKADRNLINKKHTGNITVCP